MSLGARSRRPVAVSRRRRRWRIVLGWQKSAAAAASLFIEDADVLLGGSGAGKSDARHAHSGAGQGEIGERATAVQQSLATSP